MHGIFIAFMTQRKYCVIIIRLTNVSSNSKFLTGLFRQQLSHNFAKHKKGGD